MKKTSVLRLADLPPPPAGKSGWPWTEESPAVPARLPDGSEWPLISIVTPSFNQGAFIEETLRSVLLQNYPNLEYIVIDGGSVDDTAEVLRRYEPFLDQVVSEPDGGHADGLNKGMRRATGSILAFINSDDFYLPGALASVAGQFHAQPSADLIYGGCLIVDQAGREIIEHFGDVSRLDDVLDYGNVWRANREIVQPEAFWRRSIFEKTGAFNPKIRASFCHEYWCRMLIAGARFHRLERPLACFRLQPGQRSQREPDSAYAEYLNMVEPWLWDRAVPLSAPVRRALQSEWLFDARYVPACARSIERGESSLRRWMGTALLCARHPRILSARGFRERRKNLLGKFSRLGRGVLHRQDSARG
jgi:glycosyltransferase involved in cell wall biosynthesis